MVCASVRFFFLLNFEEAFNAAAAVAAVGGGGVPYRTQNSVSIEVARAVHLLFALIIVLRYFYFISFYFILLLINLFTAVGYRSVRHG